jgi:hypothetical protein
MPEHIREFLIALGIADQPHSGRTFIEHLEGVYRLLLKENDCDIALAGALHAVYGTESYRPRRMPAREEVRALIGQEAEALVWLFCMTKRKQLRALSAIDKANEMEQGNG